MNFIGIKDYSIASQKVNSVNLKLVHKVNSANLLNLHN